MYVIYIGKVLDWYHSFFQTQKFVNGFWVGSKSTGTNLGFLESV